MATTTNRRTRRTANTAADVVATDNTADTNTASDSDNTNTASDTRDAFVTAFVTAATSGADDDAATARTAYRAIRGNRGAVVATALTAAINSAAGDVAVIVRASELASAVAVAPSAEPIDPANGYALQVAALRSVLDTITADAGADVVNRAGSITVDADAVSAVADRVLSTVRRNTGTSGAKLDRADGSVRRKGRSAAHVAAFITNAATPGSYTASAIANAMPEGTPYHTAPSVGAIHNYLVANIGNTVAGAAIVAGDDTASGKPTARVVVG